MPSGKHSKQRRAASTARILVPVVLVLVGLLVLAYPVVATQWNNRQQEKVAEEYANLDNQMSQEERDTALAAARDYNSRLQGGPVLDPWLDRIARETDAYKEYESVLNQSQAMARLVVPTAKINLAVYHGTDEKTLQQGVGHLFGSALPVGGEGTHAVLTGHSGLANATLFDNLRDVKQGDPIYVQTSGEKLKYEVDQIKVVLPYEVDDLKPVAGQDYLTLITCTPYGINSHRLLVRGHRVEMDASDVKAMDEASGAKWQWWMTAMLAAVAIVAAILLWWLRKQLKAKKA